MTFNYISNDDIFSKTIFLNILLLYNYVCNCVQFLHISLVFSVMKTVSWLLLLSLIYSIEGTSLSFLLD